jgi:hypothetical protein
VTLEGKGGGSDIETSPSPALPTEGPLPALGNLTCKRARGCCRFELGICLVQLSAGTLADLCCVLTSLTYSTHVLSFLKRGETEFTSYFVFCANCTRPG